MPVNWIKVDWDIPKDLLPKDIPMGRDQYAFLEEAEKSVWEIYNRHGIKQKRNQSSFVPTWSKSIIPGDVYIAQRILNQIIFARRWLKTGSIRASYNITRIKEFLQLSDSQSLSRKQAGIAKGKKLKEKLTPRNKKLYNEAVKLNEIHGKHEVLSILCKRSGTPSRRQLDRILKSMGFPNK